MDLKEIRQLIRFLSGTDVSEIEITEEGKTVRINRAPTGPTTGTVYGPAPTPQHTYIQSAPEPAPKVDPATEIPVTTEEKIDGVTINSPMVGTIYLAPSPESPHFIAVGDIVKKGQVVCIVEAMKLMNEIESEVSGRVVSVLKDNASPVEYGEPLFQLEEI
ncbi:MAG: acetyl-CoA carboxylase biotin carboxyl carrier protein [Magnetococcales bacterium]|nr:acetyl-CoA carboxylase biotin carboxyl carrier protein [Magnetococcales bacterium]